MRLHLSEMWLHLRETRYLKRYLIALKRNGIALKWNTISLKWNAIALKWNTVALKWNAISLKCYSNALKRKLLLLVKFVNLEMVPHLGEKYKPIGLAYLINFTNALKGLAYPVCLLVIGLLGICQQTKLPSANLEAGPHQILRHFCFAFQTEA